MEHILGTAHTRRQLVVLLFVAGLIRILGGWLLGEGAPFGPDGTGLEAAVSLGEHLYPTHVALLNLTGSAKLLSMLLGTVSVGLMWTYCRAIGLGTSGAWIMATIPMAVYPSILSAGDAPALFFVLLGANIAVHCPRKGIHSWWAGFGSLIAIASVTVKPIALPALVLLMPRPRAMGCALILIPAFSRWLQPLLQPKVEAGLLGSWWRGSQGQPPTDWLDWGLTGVQSLTAQPLWACTWVVVLAAIVSIWGEADEQNVEPWTRWTGMAAFGAALATACLFGDKLESRYLAPAVVASLPWLGNWAPQWSASILLWPTLALLTQLSALRAELDPMASPPDVPLISPPIIDARPLFENASTEGATEMREEAFRLAQELQPGQSHSIERRLHGREGELIWPLKVLRPDIEVSPDPERPLTHLQITVPE